MKVELRGRLVLVGAGKMGGAMLEGWLKEGVPPGRIVVLDPSPPPETRSALTRQAVLLNPPLSSLGDVEVLLLAVKPQIMDEVLGGIRELAKGKPLIVSVAAGKTIAYFERHFGAGSAIVRTIPNLPASIGRGITAMVASPRVSRAERELAMALLSAIGEVVALDDESLIDAATAVSGSGPAYVFYLAECMAEAGRRLGLPDDVSVKLARATIAGAGELMRASGLPAATLRENVTSPKGTTHAALQILMAEGGMMGLFAEALAAAERRSRELAS
jgi:pyrroline-5-carboxylate reductase